MAARHGTISPTLRAGVPFFGGAEGGRGGLAVMECTLPCGGGGCRWELRPAWPCKPGGVPWARGPLRGRTSDSPGGTPRIYICVCVYVYVYIYIYIYIYPLIYTPLPYSMWLHSKVRAKGTTWCIHVAEGTKLDQNGLKMGSKHLFVHPQGSEIIFGKTYF